MDRDLIADLYCAITSARETNADTVGRKLSMRELSAAVDGLSGADQTRLAIGYSNAWEKRERACLEFDTELQKLWQRITVF